MKKILILNSDSPFNKGDQAILLGSIKLIKSVWPDSEITAISNFRERDEDWFGIKFINMAVYTINPIAIIRLALAARSYDIIFWGGGELLKDYTTKLAPLYWLVRILVLRIFNANIYGLFQGIGPTKSKLSKWAITKSVNLCKLFFLRDSESKDKLLAFGVCTTKLISGYDPAILNEPSSNPYMVLQTLGLSRQFAEKSIIVSVRKWFHYEQSSWTPLALQRTSKKQPTHSLEIYRRNLTSLLESVIEDHDVNIIFFPMFMSENEGDYEFSKSIADNLPNQRVVVVDSKSLQPQEMINLFSVPKLTLSTRLHSSIISISSLTPAICLYYVDKGRVFFEQLSAGPYSFPIEATQNKTDMGPIKEAINNLLKEPQLARSHFQKNLDNKRIILKIFKNALRDNDAI